MPVGYSVAGWSSYLWNNDWSVVGENMSTQVCAQFRSTSDKKASHTRSPKLIPEYTKAGITVPVLKLDEKV